MKILRGILELSRPLPHPVLTIGNFDGLHLGHQEIIKLAIEKARVLGGTAIAYTFRPHPLVALRPEATVQLLTTYDEKIELIGKLGVDLTIEEPFNREFSTVTPEHFFNEFLRKRLKVEAIVVGYDFAFGKDRAGHLDALRKFCDEAGVELTVCRPHRVAGNAVSSSRIRQHLLAGEVEAASLLLGREFMYRGVVLKGEGRGRKLGFPTANLSLEHKLTLPYGVYATWAICRGKTYPSVTNIGIRPTFQVGASELPALVETHLLDTSLDLYGETLEVRFVKRLREERKFAGVEALRAQILLDAQAARELLTE